MNEIIKQFKKEWKEEFNNGIIVGLLIQFIWTTIIFVIMILLDI